MNNPLLSYRIKLSSSLSQGKIEFEIEILTEEEAREKPAGRAREEPNENPKLEAPQFVSLLDFFHFLIHFSSSSH